MLAIFTTGGKQHRAEKGLEFKVEKLDKMVGDEVTFDKVLMVSDGTSPVVGRPYVAGAAVKAEILAQGRNKKIIVFKQKQRKGYRRKQGHRQPYTRIRITDITQG